MNFFLKILNESRSRQIMKVDGASGARFLFTWDQKIRSYRYQPKSQDEVDDLYRTMGRTTAYTFCPVNAEAPAPASPPQLRAEGAVVPPVLPTPIEDVKVPLDDKLVEECLHRAVIVTEDDTNEVARRLVAAYDKGAADALNSLPALKRKPRARAKAAQSSMA